MVDIMEKHIDKHPPLQGPETTTGSAGQLSILGANPVHQYRAPVTICTLTDDTLRDTLMQEPVLKGIIIGSLHTENLGIEQIMTYALENPNVRFVILCGLDGKKAIGHLPGQSFLALGQHGIDDSGRILNAEGKRPYIKNLSREAVDHFRNTVELVDLVGTQDIATILETVEACIARSPGLAEAFSLSSAEQTVTHIRGSAPDRMQSDPAGYFVISVHQDRHVIRMEHYTNDGCLNTVIEGTTGPSLYFPALEQKLVSLMDHAAYLGRELYRAERAFKSGEPYVQDAEA